MSYIIGEEIVMKLNDLGQNDKFEISNMVGDDGKVKTLTGTLINFDNVYAEIKYDGSEYSTFMKVNTEVKLLKNL